MEGEGRGEREINGEKREGGSPIGLSSLKMDPKNLNPAQQKHFIKRQQINK